METRRIRRERRQKIEIPTGAIPCTAFEVWFYAQQEAALHHTKSASNFHCQQMIEDSQHSQAKALGANCLY